MFVLTFIGLLLSSEFLSFQLALMHFSNASRVPKVTSWLAAGSLSLFGIENKGDRESLADAPVALAAALPGAT
jgi:hypothetical protein